MRTRRVLRNYARSRTHARWISALSQSDVTLKDSMAFQRRIYYPDILYSGGGCKDEERTGEMHNRKQILWDLSRQLSGSAAKRASLLHQSGNVKFHAYKNREIETRFMSEKKYRSYCVQSDNGANIVENAGFSRTVRSQNSVGKCQGHNWPLHYFL